MNCTHPARKLADVPGYPGSVRTVCADCDKPMIIKPTIYDQVTLEGDEHPAYGFGYKGWRHDGR